jgi:hypothetical protein
MYQFLPRNRLEVPEVAMQQLGKHHPRRAKVDAG